MARLAYDQRRRTLRHRAAFPQCSCTAGDHPTLFWHRGGFYGWSGTAYPELDASDLRASLYGFLNGCAAVDPKGNPHPFRPNKSKVANVLDARQAAANLPATIAAPAWLDSVPDRDPRDIIACRN